MSGIAGSALRLWPVLAWLLATSPDALATSCGLRFDPPQQLVRPDLDSAEAAELQHHEQQLFEAQTRADLANYPLIAIGRVQSATGIVRWDLGGLATIEVSRYFRQPESKAPDDLYHVTVADSLAKPGAELLFMAWPETADQLAQRTAPPPPPELREFTRLGLPREPARIWYSQQECQQTAHALDGPHAAALLPLLERLAADRLAPAQLRLIARVPDEWNAGHGPDAQEPTPSTHLALDIEALDPPGSSRQVQVAVDRNANPTATELELPPGRYRLRWPELAGFWSPCDSSSPRPADCTLELVAGSQAQLYVEYRPRAELTTVVLDANGNPVNFIGELALLRTPAPGDPAFLPPQVLLQQEYGVDDPLAEIEARNGRPVPPGDYQLAAVLRSFAPTPRGSSDTCRQLERSHFPLRWKLRDGGSDFALHGRIGDGEQVVLVQLPADPQRLLQLRFEQPQLHDGDIVVGPRCKHWLQYAAGGHGGVRELLVSMLRGQQYQLEYACPDCSPPTRGQRTAEAQAAERIELHE